MHKFKAPQINADQFALMAKVNEKIAKFVFDNNLMVISYSASPHSVEIVGSEYGSQFVNTYTFGGARQFVEGDCLASVHSEWLGGGVSPNS